MRVNHANTCGFVEYIRKEKVAFGWQGLKKVAFHQLFNKKATQN